MNNKTFLFACSFIFLLLLVIEVSLYYFFVTSDLPYFWYGDSALFGTGLAAFFLWIRKYMTQSYSLDQFKDFFVLDASLSLLWVVLFGVYFIVV